MPRLSGSAPALQSVYTGLESLGENSVSPSVVRNLKHRCSRYSRPTNNPPHLGQWQHLPATFFSLPYDRALSGYLLNGFRLRASLPRHHCLCTPPPLAQWQQQPASPSASLQRPGHPPHLPLLLTELQDAIAPRQRLRSLGGLRGPQRCLASPPPGLCAAPPRPSSRLSDLCLCGLEAHLG